MYINEYRKTSCKSDIIGKYRMHSGKHQCLQEVEYLSKLTKFTIFWDSQVDIPSTRVFPDSRYATIQYHYSYNVRVFSITYAFILSIIQLCYALLYFDLYVYSTSIHLPIFSSFLFLLETAITFI